MEYPAKGDFFLKFRALYNGKKEFLDYVLIETSKDFKSLSGKSPDKLIGKKLSELVVTEGDFIPGEKEIYYQMIPNINRKFGSYIESLDKFYLITVFSDSKDYMLVFYSDISKLKCKNIVVPSNFKFARHFRRV